MQVRSATSIMTRMRCAARKRRELQPYSPCRRSAARLRPRASRGATAIRSRPGSASWRATGWMPASTRTSFRPGKKLPQRRRRPSSFQGRNSRARSRFPRSTRLWKNCHPPRRNPALSSRRRSNPSLHRLPRLPSRTRPRRRPPRKLRLPRPNPANRLYRRRFAPGRGTLGRHPPFWGQTTSGGLVMATRTQSRSSSTSRSGGRNSSRSGTENRSKESQSRSQDRSERSAFSWGDNAGPLLGAALAGAAIGFAANYGRKFMMQGLEAAAGDWDNILAAEHELALGIFDKMLATDQTQTWKRSMLLMKLTHALDKHAHQEEMVVYPALREANMAVDADQLEGEHGYIKTFIYELKNMGPSSPNWLEKVREFRALVSKHAHMEEEEVFPAFKQNMTDEQNKKVTGLVNADGFWMA